MADELHKPRSEDGPDWAAYYRHTQGRQPGPLFLKAMAAVAASGARPGHAVEIGFGDGTETLALLADGWHVTAIDPTPEAAQALRAAVPAAAANRLVIVTALAQDAELPPLDLLYAGYALSFIRPTAFGAFWERLRERLRSGGILAANVFGARDSWAGDPEMTFVDREGAERLVEGLEVIAIDEEDADGNSFDGPKHWHVFDLVARRPPAEVA